MQVISKEEIRRTHIQDIDLVNEKFSHIFEHGGFIAGGSLRRAVSNGSFFETFNPFKVWLMIVNDGYRRLVIPDTEKTLKATNLSDKRIVPDVDVYFRSEQAIVGFLKACESERSQKEYDRKTQTRKTKQGTQQNLYRRYALNSTFKHRDKLYKLQYIPSWISSGAIEDVIEEFDFENCKFAYDGIYLYFTEKAMHNEKGRILEFCKSNKSSISEVASRCNKYLALLDSNDEPFYRTAINIDKAIICAAFRSGTISANAIETLSDKRSVKTRKDIYPLLALDGKLFDKIKANKQCYTIGQYTAEQARAVQKMFGIKSVGSFWSGLGSTKEDLDF